MAALEAECERLIALGATRVERHEPAVSDRLCPGALGNEPEAEPVHPLVLEAYADGTVWAGSHVV